MLKRINDKVADLEIEKKLVEISEHKNTIIEVRNAVDGINSRLNRSDKIISKLDDNLE